MGRLVSVIAPLALGAYIAFLTATAGLGAAELRNFVWSDPEPKETVISVLIMVSSLLTFVGSGLFYFLGHDAEKLSSSAAVGLAWSAITSAAVLYSHYNWTPVLPTLQVPLTIVAGLAAISGFVVQLVCALPWPDAKPRPPYRAPLASRIMGVFASLAGMGVFFAWFGVSLWFHDRMGHGVNTSDALVLVLRSGALLLPAVEAARFLADASNLSSVEGRRPLLSLLVILLPCLSMAVLFGLFVTDARVRPGVAVVLAPFAFGALGVASAGAGALLTGTALIITWLRDSHEEGERQRLLYSSSTNG